MKNKLYFFLLLWSFSSSAQVDTINTKLSPFGLGGGMSFGVNVIQGQLGKQFSPINLGGEAIAEIMYKRWVADIGLKLIFSRNTKQITYQNSVFDKKEIVFETIFKSLIGYDILKNKNWRLIPFTGFGYGNIVADDPIIKPAPSKDFAYLNSGIIIDKFIGNYYFKNAPNQIDFFPNHPFPSLSWRLKAEFIHPFLNNDYTQFNGDIFQITFGAMIYIHGYNNRFITYRKKIKTP